MEATWQYFPVVLFIMLCKVILTFESVDEILKCDHLNESYWAVLSCGTVYYAVQGGSNFWVCGRNPMVSLFTWKLLSSTLLWHFLWYCRRWLWYFVSRQLKSYGIRNSHKSYWVVPSFGAVYDGPAVCFLEWNPRVWLFIETLLRSNFPVSTDSWSGFVTFFAVYFDRSQIKIINLIASTQCSQKLHALKFSFLHGTFINMKWYQILKNKNWCASLQF